MSTEPTPHPAREIAEKIVGSYLQHTDTESIPFVDTLKELIESALTRSEEEKNNERELSEAKLRMRDGMIYDLKDQLSTLTARLKEAENEIKSLRNGGANLLRFTEHHTNCHHERGTGDCNCFVRQAEQAFLDLLPDDDSASTPVEKKA